MPNSGVNVEEVEAIVNGKADRTCHEVFKLFAIIHKLTQDVNVIKRIAKETVCDFAADNVVYLELRTTPRRLNGAATLDAYVQAVLQGVEEGMSLSANIVVYVLLSIDRKMSTQEALEVVHIAAKYSKQGVIGVDLSGNPAVGEWSTWLPALQLARALNLPVALHCGELEAPEEVAKMIAFSPARLGHVNTLPHNSVLWAMLLASGIPVELCVSSNVITEVVGSYKQHHVHPLLLHKHPLSVCTDDKLVMCAVLCAVCCAVCVRVCCVVLSLSPCWSEPN
eukprot:CAMPEP_0175122896 /NCGR_PEP_ID=MMETSP0087-20121206/1954_1 /TAXON_ID=136419 /ORGANISM="Unknown Unknown, Strain D1" /LENGTH=279 /DNA_ID=CAMNT_0016404551 /DNA_START=63 /DNA_END=902 /DNA_ORIENTATION=+